jgi:hypothetical protein
VTQHIRDAEVLKILVKILGCGKFTIRSNRPEIGDFLVTKFKDIKYIIIPFFLKYPFQGNKLKDFLELKQVFELMVNNKASLTKFLFEKINKIIYIKKSRKAIIQSPFSKIEIGKVQKRFYSTAPIINNSKEASKNKSSKIKFKQ